MGEKAAKALYAVIWTTNIRIDAKIRIFNNVVQKIVLYVAKM